MKKKDSDSTLVIEHYEKKIYDQKQLLEISKALNSTLDYKYLIDAILNICLAQLQTLKAAIYLAPDVDADHLILDPSHKGFDVTKDDEERKIKIDSPLIHHLEQKPRAVTVQQLTSAFHSDDVEYFKKMGVEIIIPLNAKGKVNGLLILGEKLNMSDFVEEEKDFLTTLAGLAGIAVENSRLYELATVDMMTQLKIHHYFQSKLREEMDRCRKKGTKLALLFTDIDKFKVFNDTHGHQAGDVVLIEVAKKLIESARKNDIAARYGGEEFCVIMPGADINDGFEMGEKIRKAVEAHRVKNPNGGDDLKVTISIGVTEFHANDKNNKEMIERSDKALYKAKHGGRNQTISLQQ
ncbi:MAG: sensor domain-containing diguanylate cyclase [Leptospira sp.]|nr:sensor domain-containing diguanylate cyclase [Leptospira sp.]